jgi:hypothetical protein
MTQKGEKLTANVLCDPKSRPKSSWGERFTGQNIVPVILKYRVKLVKPSFRA